MLGHTELLNFGSSSLMLAWRGQHPGFAHLPPHLFPMSGNRHGKPQESLGPSRFFISSIVLCLNISSPGRDVSGDAHHQRQTSGRGLSGSVREEAPCRVVVALCPWGWRGAGAAPLASGVLWVMLSIWFWLGAPERLFLLLKRTPFCAPLHDFLPMYVKCWSLLCLLERIGNSSLRCCCQESKLHAH